MLFAYQQNPPDFDNRFSANGIPDIQDEAGWSLQWLVKMNPRKGVMYKQVADDRNNAGFRLPDKDSVRYDAVHSAHYSMIKK